MADEMKPAEPKPLKDEDIISREGSGVRALLTAGALLFGAAVVASAQNKRTDPDQKKHKRTDPDQKKHHRSDPDQKKKKKKKQGSKSDPDHSMYGR
ncbi:MAG: hypothetical protein ACRD13_08495 [Terriglobales bacterium]